MGYVMVNLDWQHGLISNELKDKLLADLWGDVLEVTCYLWVAAQIKGGPRRALGSLPACLCDSLASSSALWLRCHFTGIRNQLPLDSNMD